MLEQDILQYTQNAGANTERVYQLIVGADAPISIEDISVRTLLPLDVVNRAVARLLEAGRIGVYEQAPETDLELQPKREPEPVPHHAPEAVPA